MSAKPAPPFLNNYTVKLVADSDSKSCFICYKPTPTVLLSENSVDFFYVCTSHLKDDNFAISVKPDDYTDLVKEKIDLESKVEKLQKQADAVKPYKLTSIVYDYLGKGTDTDSKKDPKEDDKKSEDTAKSEPSKDAKYKTLMSEIKDVKADLAKVTTSIDTYKFKNYQLNKSIYIQRIQNYNKVRYNRARSQKIQSDPGFFPSAPTTKIE